MKTIVVLFATSFHELSARTVFDRPHSIRLLAIITGVTNPDLVLHVISVRNALIMVVTSEIFFTSVFTNRHLEGGCNTLVGTFILPILSTEKTGLEAADTVLSKPGRYRLD